MAPAGWAAAAGRAFHQVAGQGRPELGDLCSNQAPGPPRLSSGQAMPFAIAPAASTTCCLEASSFKSRARAAGAHAGERGRVLDAARRRRRRGRAGRTLLGYLVAIERSPNTVRAYAVSLKPWFEFLAWADLSWQEVGIEELARFVAWLRGPAPNVVVLAEGAGARRPATVNRYLASVFGFYDHHARSGLGVAAELVAWRRASGAPTSPSCTT